MSKLIQPSSSDLLERTHKGWHWVWPTLFRLAALGGIGGAGALFYARQIEPRWIQWRTLRLRIEGWPREFEGYRVLQLSDLHFAKGKVLDPTSMGRLVARANRLNPDVILITGDFISRADPVSQSGIEQLARLKACDGVFGIPGNHDYWNEFERLTPQVEAAGIQMLINAHRTIRRGNAAISIAGVDDIWEGHPDLNAALRGTDWPVILMAHESNFADSAAEDTRVSLQLSGHSHGGQVRVPFLGPLALPDMAWRYPMGLYRVKRPHRRDARPMWLYTSRGVGLAEVPLRFGCRPEVTLFEVYGR